MKKEFFFSWALLLTLITSCAKNFEVIEDLGNSSYNLIDQEGSERNFPAFVKNKIVVAGYIFTNCPDICPLTTNNMRLIQERLNKDEVEGVQFVSVSFDPDNDTPEVLKNFARIRNLDLSNWTFLTGAKPDIDKLMKQVGVLAVPGDSTVFPSGKVSYYYIHTDRIQLIDGEGKIRKNYTGSAISVDEIVDDIKSIAN
ncbi:MAG TPA: SCO family protein [Melioribacteraceae bacterium]|nr:SCO family protein [Melioribacteraceae bacterium]